MSGSTFGKIFTVTTWGESHGAAIGAVVDGCPAGLLLCEDDIQAYLNRRKPGQSRYTTARSESDAVQILSGVFEGKTTGTPISLLVQNTDQHSKDYSNLAACYRPGHADYPFDAKYGFRDYRGGGRSSGRETIGRVAAGAIACKLLDSLGITLHAYATAIGPVEIDRTAFDLSEAAHNPLGMPDAAAAAAAQEYLDKCISDQDSCGGIIECVMNGLPTGIGDPVFDKLDAGLAKAMLSIGSVKGFEMGDGFAAAASNGSTNNDAFISENGQIKKATNHAGGTLGGISDGSPVVFRVAVKPTPSISRPQQTVNTSGEPVTLTIQGRHDPIIVPRAIVVVECMAALTTADLLLSNMSARLDHVKKIYER